MGRHIASAPSHSTRRLTPVFVAHLEGEVQCAHGLMTVVPKGCDFRGSGPGTTESRPAQPGGACDVPFVAVPFLGPVLHRWSGVTAILLGRLTCTTSHHQPIILARPTSWRNDV